MSSYGLPEAEQLVRKYLAEQGDDATQVVMDEYDRRGDVEARYAEQVIGVIAHVPGPDPDDLSEDWDRRVVDELERLRAMEQRVDAAYSAADSLELSVGLRYLLTGDGEVYTMKHSRIRGGAS